jgi:hypothetical protein
MTLRTRWVLVSLALLMFAFSVAFAIATLAGLTILSALIAGEAAAAALIIVLLVMNRVPATMIREEQLTIRASREAVYAAIADPRSGSRHSPDVVAVEDLVGEPGVVGTRWRTTLANGMVVTAEVVAAEPPARLVIRSRNVPLWPRRRTFMIETERSLVTTPAGTEITVRMMAMNASLLARLIERFQRAQAARRRRWSNERLRDELEAAEKHKVAPPS